MTTLGCVLYALFGALVGGVIAGAPGMVLGLAINAVIAFGLYHEHSMTVR